LSKYLKIIKSEFKYKTKINNIKQKKKQKRSQIQLFKAKCGYTIQHLTSPAAAAATTTTNVEC
jgi:hypothetical protein